jgi:cytidylate kinase
MAKRIVVAIDGPAGSGKSTIARRLAAKLGFLYIDSGAMYRAVGLWAVRANIDPADAHRLGQLAREARIELEPGSARVLLNGEDVSEAIRTPEVSQAASKVSAVPGVRRAMVEEQRRMAAQNSVVMEGRDIGTVVFPHAEIKIFLDADPTVRARRRFEEAAERGETIDPQEMARQIGERDQRDRTRSEAPLVQAPDATYVDSTGLSIDQVEEAVLKLIRERTSNGKELTS